MSFESFVLLSPNSFAVPVINTHLDMESALLDAIDDPSDLHFRHHLYIYAFPPFDSVKLPDDPSEPVPPPHRATTVAVIDMPSFHTDFQAHQPPPRMSIRTDPPPRHTFPTHPRTSVQAFAPDPVSGIITIEFLCQLAPPQEAHYMLVVPKRTLLDFVPGRDDARLRSAMEMPVPATSWASIAPKVRLFGPDMVPSRESLQGWS
jgi:hypothetical protein